jgi:HEAT repeat protein
LRAAVEGLARAGDKDAVAAAAASLARNRRPEVTLGVAFARVKTGEPAPLETLLQAAGGRDTSLQVQDYLVELGPAAAKPVAAVLPAASSEARQRLIEVLGVIGGDEQLPALQAAQKDESAAVAAAAERAVRRLKAR